MVAPLPFGAVRLLPALCALLALCGCVTRPPVFHGPMQVRNQHPAQLTVLHMAPRGAAPPAAGSARLDAAASYTSLFLGGDNNGNSFRMDGEILRTGLGATIGLGHGFDLQVELALAHTTGGFLDDFVVGWHEFFGFPDQGRDEAPRDNFGVIAQRSGTTVYEMTERDLALLDFPVTLSWTPVPVSAEQPVGFGLRAGVELPTGDADRGFGNDEVDVALGAFGELRHGWLSLTGHAQHTFAGTPDRAAAGGLDFEDVTSVGVGAELAFHDRFRALVQFELETSTLRGLDLNRTSREQALLWTGVRTAISDRVALDIGLGEDLSSFVAPDFTAFVGLRATLGGGGGPE